MARKPYAFLDDAPAEERRTQAIRSRHLLDADTAADLARIDPAAIDAVCDEIAPTPRSADELHDALVLAGFLGVAETTARWGALQPMFDTLLRERRVTRADPAGGASVWVSAERLDQFLLACPAASLAPAIDAVGPGRGEPCRTAEDALREIVRSRLEFTGPVTAGELAAPLGIDPGRVSTALLALEVEGFAMRGRFRGDAAAAGGDSPDEWCERRLLARIHRRTIRSLRAQIEPVSPADFMRFLFAWHGVQPERPTGPEAVAAALRKLEGFAAPAGLWETALLPQRVAGYLKSDLDQLLNAGRFAWYRPVPDDSEGRRSGPVRNTPILIVERARIGCWQASFRHATDEPPPLSSAALAVQAALKQYGASFFADLVTLTGLLRVQVEQGLAELVAWGLVTCDSFAGLRALIAPASRRASFSRPRRRGALSVDSAGRWTLIEASMFAVPPQRPATLSSRSRWHCSTDTALCFAICCSGNRGRLPRWRELVRVLRRLEARGDIRGGRFVTALSGEQFARPDAVEQLRRLRGSDRQIGDAIISAADPLNLTGIVTPGKRIPSGARNRILYRDGLPIAWYVGGRFEWLGRHDAAAEWSARNLLIRHDPDVAYIPTPGRPS